MPSIVASPFLSIIWTQKSPWFQNQGLDETLPTYPSYFFFLHLTRAAARAWALVRAFAFPVPARPPLRPIPAKYFLTSGVNGFVFIRFSPARITRATLHSLLFRPSHTTVQTVLPPPRIQTDPRKKTTCLPVSRTCSTISTRTALRSRSRFRFPLSTLSLSRRSTAFSWCLLPGFPPFGFPRSARARLRVG